MSPDRTRAQLCAPTDGGTVASVRNLRKDYPMNGESVHALRGVTLEIHQGDYAAIVGPSGCGKSTLLQLLGGIDTPSGGSVELLGQHLETMGDSQLTRLRLTKIGFVFQRFHLLPVLSARENVELPMAEAGVNKAERRARAKELLGYVGLDDRANHRATQLSGGEMQRVAIARALANRPALILADEPTGELDAATGRGILDLFKKLAADGSTLVVVTHDDRLASEAGRVIQMLDGCIVRDVPRSSFLVRNAGEGADPAPQGSHAERGTRNEER